LPKKPKANKFSARDEARAYLPRVIERLKDEVANGKGIARIKASELLVKLADLGSIPHAVDDEIIIEDATQPVGE
jgi:hypothetical protein